MSIDIASDVVLDPLLAERVSIIRRAEAMDAHGRSQVTPTTTPNVVGVVTMYEDIELMRQEFPEMQFATRVISFISKFRTQSATVGFQPDLIAWRGDNYVVKRVSPYPQFGAGFYEAVAMSIDRMEAAI